MALWINNHSPFVHHPFILRSSPNGPLDQQHQQIRTIILQDQAQKPLKIRSSPLFKIKPQRSLKKHSSSRSSPNGSLKIRSNPPSKIKPTVLEESALRSLFIVLPRSIPDDPWINNPPIQDQAPKALEELPPIQDQAPTAFEESNIRSSSVHPKIKPQRPFGLTNVDKSIHPTVLQDQAQKPLKISSSLLFKIKPQRPLKKHSSSRSSPNGSLKIPSNPPSKIKPTTLEETSNSSSKIKPRRPLDQRNIHKSTPYGD
ncbi:hypothetical protein PS2_023165 [Malus domestica]